MPVANRRGLSWVGTLIGLSVLVGVPLAAAWLVPWGSLSEKKAGPLVHKVAKGVFTNTVTEQGELESSSNVEVRCEVQSRGSGSGVAIIEIVPEGTHVAQGDFLIRFDASSLENELNQQQIKVNTSLSTVISSQNTLDTATIAEREYLEGTFKQEEKTLEGDIFIAQEDLRRAEDYARFSEKLAAKGYITQLQLDADRFAVEKARKTLEIASTKLDVLRRFTREKMLRQLQADIKIADAKLQADQEVLKLDEEKLQLIKDQIAKCVVTAPAAGQVVYANQSEGRNNNSEFIVQEGAVVRERQVVIRLPDPARMQVKTKINESRIDRVQAGQFALVKLDALPEKQLEGVVRKVDEYPLAGNWFSSAVKEYGAYVEIKDASVGLRPGMTAQVKIYVEQAKDVIQVPVQTVFERGGTHFTVVRNGEKLEARQVEIGSTNDTFIVIRGGLKEGDEVLLEPTLQLDNVQLPAEVLVASSEQVRELPKLDPKSARPAGAVAADATAGGDAKRERGNKRGGSGGAGGMGQMADMEPAAMVDMMFPTMDKDSDGRLSKDEMPERGKANFDQTDANKDGFVDREEMIAAMTKLKERMAAAAKKKAADGEPPAEAGEGGQSGS
ncbi:MAG: efflux RND transporter periplasmic adaptor subunit [Pirellulales bacterium]|nr:efflux RND transporter periplasmic adaptor subunit [Pirellulales bacterium]